MNIAGNIYFVLAARPGAGRRFRCLWSCPWGSSEVRSHINMYLKCDRFFMYHVWLGPLIGWLAGRLSADQHISTH
eukprot:2216551-Heterocapsa_arctica.AAC.1